MKIFVLVLALLILSPWNARAQDANDEQSEIEAYPETNSQLIDSTSEVDEAQRSYYLMSITGSFNYYEEEIEYFMNK